MKYTDTQIGFQEFPNEISLLINISNCPFHCPGCHSPELWEDIGNILNVGTLKSLIKSNKGISCVGFMGGVPEEVNAFIKVIKKNYDLKVGWYWGDTNIPEEIDLELFDYIKLGPYIKELGGLNNPNTNQRFYHIKDGILVDWTYKFWKHGNKQ
jgi:anaerobic ribonucleoside-triphosphate reductase activating protein